MTKPRTAKPKATQKAPGAARPRAPFEPTHKSPPSTTRPVGPDSKRDPYLAKKRAAKSQPVPAIHPEARSRTGFGAKVNRRAADRLRDGYLWVYASDIESLELPAGDPPSLLPVADSRGLLLGTALYSPSSQIALRMVSRDAIDDAGWLTLLADRLRAAVVRRKPLLGEQTSACRLCFSEADELPGLVVDKYGDLIIVQFLTKGL